MSVFCGIALHKLCLPVVLVAVVVVVIVAFINTLSTIGGLLS